MHDENERSWIIKVGGSNWVRHPGELTQDFLKAGSFGPRVFAEAVAREWPDSSIHEDPRKRISELEAENRRMREALARVHQYLCALQTVSDDLGPHVSSKSVDEHEAIARAALSQEDRDGT